MNIPCIGHLHRLAWVESAGPQHGVALTNSNGGLMAAARGNRNKAFTFELSVDIPLLVCGCNPLGIRQHPHLDEVHVVAVTGVHLGVPDAGSRAHPLREAGINDAAVPSRILVLELSVQPPR